MKATKIMALLLLCGICRNAYSQTRYVKGFIKDATTKIALSRVSIYNWHNQKKYMSNEYGAFTIEASLGDSIMISSIGYQPMKITINTTHFQSIQHWYIQAIQYPLQPFWVQHKRDTLAMLYASHLKTDALLNDYARIFNRPKGPPFKYMPLLIVFGGCSGCITSFWEKFSDRGKELNKFERMYALYHEQMYADEKFNLNWFKKISGLNDEENLHYFKTCRPHNDFILHNNEYEIALYVRNCLTEKRDKK